VHAGVEDDGFVIDAEDLAGVKVDEVRRAWPFFGGDVFNESGG
jgi:hypothetical protein